jgi:hypothetical protein
MVEKQKLRPEVEAALEGRGLEAVRTQVAAAAIGPGTISDVPGLKAGDGQRIRLIDAECWIQRKTAEIARRDSIRYWSMLALTIVAAVAAIVAAWEGWSAVKP